MIRACSVAGSQHAQWHLRTHSNGVSEVSWSCCWRLDALDAEESKDDALTPFWQRVKDAVPKRLTTLTLGERRDRMALWQRGIHQLPTNVGRRHLRVHAPPTNLEAPRRRRLLGAGLRRRQGRLRRADAEARPGLRRGAARPSASTSRTGRQVRREKFYCGAAPSKPWQTRSISMGSVLPKTLRKNLPFPST